MLDISSLAPLVDVEIGIGLVDNSTIIRYLQSAVHAFNGMAVDQFELDDTILSREATSQEQRALVLWALYIYLASESAKASLTAVVVSNPAGRTDMKNIEWALAKRKNELWEQLLKPLMDELNMRGQISEASAHELGETKEFTSLLATRERLF